MAPMPAKILQQPPDPPDPLRQRPFGAVAQGPFRDRVIFGFRTEEAPALALQRPAVRSSGGWKNVGDVGRLMPFLDKLGISVFPQQDNEELEILRSWCAHFRARGVAFLVVREGPCLVSLYKERRTAPGSNRQGQRI